MTHDEALNLLSARIDGPLSGEQQAALDAWLAESADNRVLAEAFMTQHGELRTAFEPRREAAKATAEAVARQLPSPTPPMPASEPRAWRRWLASPLPAACAAAVVIAAGIFFFRTPKDPKPVAVLPFDPIDNVGLMPRLKPEAPKAVAINVGDSVKTAAGEKKRLTLPDGSLVYLNQNTQVELNSDRELSLKSGEVFVEAVPATREAVRFIVKTAKRTVTALGTKFAVSADAKGTGVHVTQGKVEVSDLKDKLTTGQELLPGDDKVVSAPRASAALDWTRDLMIAAESPLVPAGKHSGGSLVALDPYGQEAKLQLVKYHIDVHIEDGFARTTIDQTYFNHENSRMEGTFYFPLPPDGSLSRLAMYVDGERMEGGMAERDHARDVYETIRYQQRDPALLEWVDGSVFKMRVFPLEARQEKRIILSYSQRLPVSYNQSTYRFPSGHSLALVKDWSFRALIKDGVNLSVASPSHPDMKLARQGADLVVTSEAKNTKIDRDVVLELADHGANVNAESFRWSTGELDGQRYLMLRYRPELPTAPRRERRDWVVLFESSGARDPLVARAQVEVLRSLFNHAEHDDTISVLSVGTRIRKWSDAPKPATIENVADAIAWLEKRHLIGALNLDQAITDATSILQGASNPHIVHVGGGIASMGEQRADELVRRLPDGVRYVGIGVGKRLSPAFMKAAAEKTGGLFTQVNPDEPISWRGFEIASTLNAPRLLDVRVETLVEGGPRFLTFANSLAQGDELAAVANVTAGLPASATVIGRIDGQWFRKTIPVEKPTPGAGYLPRTWAKLEIDRLLAADSAGNKKAITDLSKAMYVMTPYTSLLVLENEKMYQDFKVDRGRKDHWAMYDCPPKIPVVYIPDPNTPVGSVDLKGQKPHPNQVMQTVMMRGRPTFIQVPGIQVQDVAVTNGSMGLDAGAAVGISGALGDGDWHDEGRPRGGKGWDVGAMDFAFLTLGDRSVTRAKQGIAKRGLQLTNFPVPGFAATSGTFLGTGETELQVESFDDSVKSKRRESLSRAMFLDRRSGVNKDSLNRLSDGSELSLGELQDGKKAFFGRQLRGGKQVRFAQPINGGVEFGLGINGNLNGKTLWDEAGETLHFFDTPALSTSGNFRQLGKRSLGRFVDGKVEAHVNPNLPVVIEEVEKLLSVRRHKNERLLDELDAKVKVVSLAETFLERRRKSREAVGEVEVEWKSDPFERAEVERANRSIRGPVAPAYYARPSYNGNLRGFTDLVAYAPGMSSSHADMQAVLEAEAAPRAAAKRGTIDPAARKLIDAARSASWQTTLIPIGKDQFLPFHHDGQGRYAYEQTLPLGLVEKVVCDGTHLWHLYPELGIGAKRVVSRFHREFLNDIAPEFVPPAEDMAVGANVKVIDDKTVAIVPNFPPSDDPVVAWMETHLVFDGPRLAERRWVLAGDWPKEIAGVLLREVYAGTETRLLDSKDKELGKAKREAKPAAALNLQPDMSQLVVLPLPLRSREVAYRAVEMEPNVQLGEGVNGCLPYFSDEAAMQLIAGDLAANQGHNIYLVWHHVFRYRGDKRLGFHTLMASCNQDPKIANLEDIYLKDRNQPLSRYLYQLYDPQQHDWNARFGTGPRDPKADTFLGRLTAFREIVDRWTNPHIHTEGYAQRDGERNHVLEFARHNADNALGWCALGLVQDRSPNAAVWKQLADVWGVIAAKSPLEYQARYEEARCLSQTSDHHAASQRKFQDLFRDALKKGVLPPLDATFRSVLDNGDQAAWSAIMRETADLCAKQKARPVIVTLAWQCSQLGDTTLADVLLDSALKDVSGDEKVFTNLAAVHFLNATGKYDRADALLGELLADERLVKAPDLWRLASQVADNRKDTVRAIERLERALDLEYEYLPEVFDVQPIRNDYGRLIGHYEWLADAAGTLKVDAPRDLLKRVVKAADRWRQLDPESQDLGNRIAALLRKMGGDAAGELAWDYATTPLALKPNESAPWVSLATSLRQEGKWREADRCYALAFAAEPTNAQLLWDRATYLREQGQEAEARLLMKQLADGEWQPRFSGVKAQAKQYAGP